MQYRRITFLLTREEALVVKNALRDQLILEQDGGIHDEEMPTYLIRLTRIIHRLEAAIAWTEARV